MGRLEGSVNFMGKNRGVKETVFFCFCYVVWGRPWEVGVHLYLEHT